MVQRDEVTSEQAGALFWLVLLAGICVAGLTAACAPVLAWFYGDERLLGLVPVMALGFVAGGLSGQHQALLRRRMRFGRLALVEVAAMCGSMVLGIAMALQGWGYWSLAGRQLAEHFLSAVGLWLAHGWLPGWPRRA